MVNWGDILSKPVGRTAVSKFVNGDLSRDSFLKVFSASKDRNANKQIRNLVRSRGANNARAVAKKALQRRNLI